MLLRALGDQQLDAILKGVSRSFYLSLQLLPASVRRQLSLAYLVARAADTVADTEVVARSERAGLLAGLVAAVGDASKVDAATAAIQAALQGKSQVADENALLAALPTCLHALAGFDPVDALATERVLATLIAGMCRDIERFDGVHLHALADMQELDTHCYAAAGCVGEYWTEITHHQATELCSLNATVRNAQRERGIRLGKALQLTNVLRDAPRDLLAGRCYIPKSLLDTVGLTPAALRDPASRGRARAVMAYLSDVALNHYEAGFNYIETIPPHARRLRVTAILPMWIGLETLATLRKSKDPLDPAAPVKIPRRAVYRILAEVGSGLVSQSLLRRLQAKKREALAA